MNGARIDLVIFDCDGVLIDSELLSAELHIIEFGKLSAHVDLAYFYKNCLGRTFNDVSARLTEHTGVVLPPDFEENFRAKLLHVFAEKLSAMPGAKSTLQKLNVPFCVATSSHHLRAESALKSAGLYDIVCNRLYTGERVINSKPAPDIFLLAAHERKVRPENCLVIEDSNVGVTAGHEAGMQVWRFTGGSHFKVSQYQYTDEIPCAQRFDKLSELIDLLKTKA